MSEIESLLAANAEYAAGIVDFPLPPPPTRQLAIVTCMDARIEVGRAFGIKEGDANLIRNAGGVVTDDVLRSLAVSQRKLGTRHVALIMHTECGLTTFDGEQFRQGIEAETGVRPYWSTETFHDLHAELRQGLRRIAQAPEIAYTDDVRGFVFDVASRRLTEVSYT